MGTCHAAFLGKEALHVVAHVQGLEGLLLLQIGLKLKFEAVASSHLSQGHHQVRLLLGRARPSNQVQDLITSANALDLIEFHRILSRVAQSQGLIWVAQLQLQPRCQRAHVRLRRLAKANHIL